jgi:hypothetical protein
MLQDKLLPQQLNRPVAQQRRQDPDRFRTVDVASDGQHDPQYQRMVADVSVGSREGGRPLTQEGCPSERGLELS